VRLPLFVSVAGRFLRHEPDRRNGVRLAVVTVALWARGRLGRPARPVRVEISIAGAPAVALCLWDYIDVLVAREVFLDGEYRLPPDLRPRTILDLGANSGITVRYFRALFPDAHVLAVEPDPANFRRLEVNCRGDTNVTLVQAAAAPEAGRATFYAVADGWASSLSERPDATPTEVEALTVRDLLGRAGWTRVDLLKLDIEGGEWPLLHAGSIAESTDFIVGELHTDAEHTLAQARALLPGFRLAVLHEHGPAISFAAASGTRSSREAPIP
jgi:FkbM family methyltransferase